jgi:hypothetical protein
MEECSMEGTRMSTDSKDAEQLTIAKVLRAAVKPLRRCLTMHDCFYCGQTIRLGQLYRDGGYNRRIHEDCYAKACATILKDYTNG